MYPDAFTDQLGQRITISGPPQRIISLVPSQTELLHDLGLDQEVVGITKFCIHPEYWRSTKTIVGGTKNLDFAAIESLQPDLIIGNKEENDRESIAHLTDRFPVWMSDIKNLEDAMTMIRQVGIMTDRAVRAKRLVDRITAEFLNLRLKINGTVLYLIWRNPWMAVGEETFIQSVIKKTGLENCISKARYPELTENEMSELNPDFIFLSSEPYPFQDKHIGELRKICPTSKALLVDGEMFSWYGSRLLKTPAYLQSLFRDLESN